MTPRTVVMAIVTLATILHSGTAARAQAPTDGELRRLSDAYTQAWAKGDAKALAGLFTTDGIQVGGDGRVAVGRKAIELAMMETLVGPYRGTKIGMVAGQTTRAGQDVYVAEGTFVISGGLPPPEYPSRGRYMNTLVRLNGRWLIAGQAIMAAPRPPK